MYMFIIKLTVYRHNGDAHTLNIPKTSKNKLKVIKIHAILTKKMFLLKSTALVKVYSESELELRVISRLLLLLMLWPLWSFILWLYYA